jgi:hypothetical protein
MYGNCRKRREDQIKGRGEVGPDHKDVAHPHKARRGISNTTYEPPPPKNENVETKKTLWTTNISQSITNHQLVKWPNNLPSDGSERHQHHRPSRNQPGDNSHPSFNGGNTGVSNPPSVRAWHVVHRPSNIKSSPNRKWSQLNTGLRGSTKNSHRVATSSKTTKSAPL